MHLGSLYTAVASYLDARAHAGRWLVRLDDLDGPRIVPGSAAGILNTLQRFGFEWDGEIVRQSDRTQHYAAALDTLRRAGLTFECSCGRGELAEGRYPGSCRAGPLKPDVPTAVRVRVAPGHIRFSDGIQGLFRQDVAASTGDIVIRRRDGLFAYVLAVVVDDAAQGVDHVIRGADLLDDTPRQIHLQRLLGLASPSYAHVPVLSEPGGKKLAKSARSVRVADAALPQLRSVFDLLGLAPPPDLIDATLADAWTWAIGRWHIDAVPKRLAIPLAS